VPLSDGRHVWNEDGDYYHIPKEGESYQRPDPSLFKDGLRSARGTFARKMERELENLPKQRKKITWGPKKGWIKETVTYNEANDEGEILKQWRVVKYINTEGVYKFSNWEMLRFSLGFLWKRRRNAPQWYRRELEELTKRADWEKSETIKQPPISGNIYAMPKL